MDHQFIPHHLCSTQLYNTHARMFSLHSGRIVSADVSAPTSRAASWDTEMALQIDPTNAHLRCGAPRHDLREYCCFKGTVKHLRTLFGFQLGGLACQLPWVVLLEG